MYWKVIFVLLAVLTYLYPAFVEEYFDVLTSNPITCSFKECCTDSWIPANYAGLAKTLKERLHGQHLVSDPVVNHLRAHGEENPHKALVLSFHGSTGTGKTYVSRLIAQNLFYKGMESKYVHLFSATKDFRVDDKVLEYSDFLRQKIKESVKKCPRSMFIFDEMHKMPAGIIDTLKPYLDHYEKVDGVDYRRATFIFLSNTGASEIDERTFSDWQNDKLRRSLTLTEMEQLIQDIALNTTNGLRNSDVVLHSLITAYIPFLPLERRHVKQCIRDSLVERKYYITPGSIPDTEVQKIANELTYFPKDYLTFSTYDCKRVREKVVTFSDEL